MIRDDVSSKLIHFTKGVGDKNSAEFRKTANQRFFSILEKGRLLGNLIDVRISYKCICFTESPIAKFPYILDEEDFTYAPLGIMVDKAWLFEKGGRPVIYQPEKEYALLSEKQKYRHKAYDPIKGGQDFTWEREWRIQSDELPLQQFQTTVIVPNRKWVDEFYRDHKETTRGLVRGAIRYGSGDEDLITSMINKLEWHFIALEDLGIKIKWDLDVS